MDTDRGARSRFISCAPAYEDPTTSSRVHAGSRAGFHRLLDAADGDGTVLARVLEFERDKISPS